jgi:hypothetical protein
MRKVHGHDGGARHGDPDLFDRHGVLTGRDGPHGRAGTSTMRTPGVTTVEVAPSAGFAGQ